MTERTAATGAQGFALTFALLFGFFVVSLAVQLPGDASPSFLRAYRGAYQTVWPQGWSFFADTPELDTVMADRLGPGLTVRGPATAPGMSAVNRWGLGRIAIAESRQAVYLAGRVPGGYWVRCGDPLADGCLRRARVRTEANGFRPARLCGTLALLRAGLGSLPAVPSGPFRRPVSVAVVRVRCP